VLGVLSSKYSGIQRQRDGQILKPEEIIKELKLQPLPEEGGFYVETYKSSVELPADIVSPPYDGTRPASTAIYYLLTPDTFSALHRLPSDEIFHFYLGDPIELLELGKDGRGRMLRLGHDIFGNMKLQHVVKGGTWQGSKLISGGSFALLGVTVAPGFSFNDYEAGRRNRLVELYPDFEKLISELTR